MKQGRLTSNTMFEGPVGDDFKLAMKYYPLLEGIHDELNKMKE